MESIRRSIAYTFFRRVHHAFAQSPVVNVFECFYHTLAGHAIVFKLDNKVLTDEVVFAERVDIKVRGKSTISCTRTDGEAVTKERFPFRNRLAFNLQYVLQAFQMPYARSKIFTIIRSNNRCCCRAIRKPHLQRICVVNFQLKCRILELQGLTLIYVAVARCRAVGIVEVTKVEPAFYPVCKRLYKTFHGLHFFFHFN